MRFTWKPAFFLLLAAPWIWWLSFAGWSGLSGARAQVALATRLLLLALFAALLSEPRAVRKADNLSLVYVVDVSDSMGEKVSDKSLEWILKTVAQKPPKDEAGLVVFGRQAAVELPPRQTFPLKRSTPASIARVRILRKDSVLRRRCFPRVTKAGWC